MSDKEFMWALKNGDLDEVKDYVAKVGGGSGGEGLGWARRRCGLRREGCAGSLQGPPFVSRPGGAAGVAGTATCLGAGSVGSSRGGGEGPGGRARSFAPSSLLSRFLGFLFSPAALFPSCPPGRLLCVHMCWQYVKLSRLTVHIPVLPP